VRLSSDVDDATIAVSDTGQVIRRRDALSERAVFELTLQAGTCTVWSIARPNSQRWDFGARDTVRSVADALARALLVDPR
jgi:hypothetical protein